MKQLCLLVLIVFQIFSCSTSNENDLRLIIQNMKQDSVLLENEILALDSTLNLKINKLTNKIDSLKSENNYLLNEVNLLSTKINNYSINKTQEVEVLEEEDEREETNIQIIDIEKPIIYLYPEKTQEIEVQLDYDGKLTHTYPKYTGVWKVTAKPDGTLFDAENKEYYALYWEGKPNNGFKIDQGFVVPGEQTIDFLENTLSKLGLNRKEANEFIIYWLPKMENNPYNLIHFSTTQYEEMARLNITPTPETLIRVMMVFKPLDNPIKIKKQNLSSTSKKRKGFTVVEWGGHPLPKSYSLDL